MISAGTLGAKYQRFFGYDINPKLDNEMTLILNRPVLDMYELENFLHAKYDEYEKEGYSMRDIILKNYGKDAVAFCKEAFAL